MKKNLILLLSIFLCFNLSSMEMPEEENEVLMPALISDINSENTTKFFNPLKNKIRSLKHLAAYKLSTTD